MNHLTATWRVSLAQWIAGDDLRTVGGGLEQQLREAQAKLGTLRLAAATALRERGAKVKEIESILGITYGMVPYTEIRRELEEGWAEQKNKNTQLQVEEP